MKVSEPTELTINIDDKDYRVLLTPDGKTYFRARQVCNKTLAGKSGGELKEEYGDVPVHPTTLWCTSSNRKLTDAAKELIVKLMVQVAQQGYPEHNPVYVALFAKRCLEAYNAVIQDMIGGKLIKASDEQRLRHATDTLQRGLSVDILDKDGYDITDDCLHQRIKSQVIIVAKRFNMISPGEPEQPKPIDETISEASNASIERLVNDIIEAVFGPIFEDELGPVATQYFSTFRTYMISQLRGRWMDDVQIMGTANVVGPINVESLEPKVVEKVVEVPCEMDLDEFIQSFNNNSLQRAKGLVTILGALLGEYSTDELENALAYYKEME